MHTAQRIRFEGYDVRDASSGPASDGVLQATEPVLEAPGSRVLLRSRREPQRREPVPRTVGFDKTRPRFSDALAGLRFRSLASAPPPGSVLVPPHGLRYRARGLSVECLFVFNRRECGL